MPDELCSYFKRTPDGMWETIKPITIKNGGLEASLGVGQRIGSGTLLAGIDVYQRLEANCR